MSAAAYPVRLDARLDPRLSRWLWLVKWVLAIPHYVVLAFLWIGFVVVSVAAFFAILFTGSYPRPLFDFNVGVLRWTWRVQYYTYGALGTDRYPPFTLRDVPDYPAHLDVAYPQRLSRGLVLVKWWLLAIPQYIVVGVLAGGGAWVAWRTDHTNYSWSGGGLIGLLVFIAAVILLFTGRYPQQLFDLVLGLNRWVMRVAAYAGLMTDEYPPFRLDMGPTDPGGSVTVGERPNVPPPTSPPTSSPASPPPPPPTGPQGRGGWTGGRTASAIIGAVLVLISLGLLAGGTAVLVANGTRDGGYVTSGTRTYTTAGYAITGDNVTLHESGPGWTHASSFLGNVRVRATSQTGAPVFVGIASTDQVNSYLGEVARLRVNGLERHGTPLAGGAPSTAPAQQQFWAASSSGTGQQTLVWKPASGSWMVVAMNAAGNRPVSISVDVGARLPSLGWIGTGLVVGGVIVLGAGIAMIAVPAVRARHTSV